MSKEVEVKEVELIPDANLEIAETVAELKNELSEVKKAMSENKVDETKEKKVSPVAEKVEDTGLVVKSWLEQNKNKNWGYKGLIEGDPSSGSTVAVPKPLQDEILRQMDETGVVRRLATKIPMTSQTVTITVTDTEPEAIWGDQMISTGDGTGATYKEVKFTRKPLEVKTLVATPLIEDRQNVLPHLSEIGGSAIRKAEDRLAVTKLTAGASNEVELIGTFTQGALTLQKMRDLYNAGTYERTGNERFFMHRNTWAKVQTLTDNVNVVDFTNQTYFGVPVEIMNCMTDPIANDGTGVTYVICTDMSKSLGLGVRNDEQVALRTSDSATVNGISCFDTNSTACKFQVDEDLQLLRNKYVSKLVSAH